LNFLILESENYSKNAIMTYQSLGNVFLNNDINFTKKDIDVLIVRLGHMIDSEFLLEFENLKYIITPTTGLNHIDITECKSKNISIISLRDCMNKIKNVSSTVELTLGLLVSLVRNINGAINDVKINNSWNRDKFRGFQLRDKKIGIIGLGRIGLAFAKICNLMGMHVYAYDPKFLDGKDLPSYISLLTFSDLLGSSDIISINASYDNNNKPLISFEEVSKMKKGVYVINTARGELINEEAVSKGIKDNHIAGLGIDVLSNEHNKEFLRNSPLFKAMKNDYNIIITPHIGGCTCEAMEYTENTIAKYFKGLLAK
tara:strand:+ start:1502 stop:2443 length:942 start_codon:yes stop_codon:yes gene_type:complete